MSDDEMVILAGPGPLAEVLPEALVRLAEAKAAQRVHVIHLPEPQVPSSAGILYLLWSNKHGMWWKPDGRGYTADIAEAGRYTEDEAVTYVVRSAHHGQLDQVTCMVAAPDNWQRPAEVSA